MTIRKSLFGNIVIFLLLSLGFLPAMGGGSEPPAGMGQGPSGPNEPADKTSPAWNDYARLIAGLSNPQGSLAAYEDKPAWVRYAKLINQGWESFARRRLTAMGEWASRELNATTSATVFYPFSGPDFINAYTLFPRAKTYLLVALEPVGDIPDFSTINEQNFFVSLERSLYELLQLNFFITNKMKTSLGKQELKGVLPVLLFFLAREDLRVLDVRYWIMNADGAIEEAPASAPEPLTGAGIPGVRIVFARAGSAETQTLYYFRFNLRNDSFTRNQHFVAFLKSFGPVTTFTKAASYLMFKNSFSAIRQFILEQSLSVLQTDSAIPLKHFSPEVWHLNFYGTYTGPILRFHNCYQPDMADMYKNHQDIRPLPFGIDYRHRLNTSNLMFASKKAEILADEAK